LSGAQAGVRRRLSERSADPPGRPRRRAGAGAGRGHRRPRGAAPLRAGPSAGGPRWLRLLPRHQHHRGDGGHDVGHPQLRDQCRGAQPREGHADQSAAAGRTVMTAITNDTQYGGAAAASGSDAPRAAVNLSDLSEMENNFITLMVAQIKTQDPTNPVDSAEFLQQYAAMSQVKSMENMSYPAR